MPRHIPLPPELTLAPFHTSLGRQVVSPRRMRGPDLERPFIGVRTVVGGCDTVLDRCLAYAARPIRGQAVSHATAAQVWGMPLPVWMQTETRIHVSSFDGGPRPRLVGVIGHELTDPALRLVTRRGILVLDPATVWLQLAATLPLDDLVAAGDHIVLTPLRQESDDPRPYVTLDKLADRVRRFRGRGRRRALEAIELVRDGAASPRETALRLALVRHGLPEPELNRAIFDPAGRWIGYGDLVYADARVVVEYEGEQHRTDAKQFYSDIERHESLVRAGWVHLRETKETPVAGPRAITSRTEAALRSRGWRPSSRPVDSGPKPQVLGPKSTGRQEGVRRGGWG